MKNPIRIRIRIRIKMKNQKDNKSIRLQLYLSRCGLGSRRKCEELIRNKRVSVNGTIVSEMGIKVGEDDKVLFDHKPVYQVKKKTYIVLNKPQKYLCSNSDSFGRDLAIDLINTESTTRLFHVGRLDYMSSGLIIYTNDGEFAQRVLHPSFEIEKEYVVLVKKRINEDFLKEFRKGIVVENVAYKLNQYQILTPYKIRLELNEGKNREIRKVFEHYRIEITKIHRVRIGSLSIKGLASGHYRSLTQKEILSFIKKNGML
jgi:23S rRNA pseudouridine2605 synthase